MQNLTHEHPPEINFHAYLDNELPSGEIDRFEQHLEACQECIETLTSLKTLYNQISRLPEVEFKTDLSPTLGGEISRLHQIEPIMKRTTWFQILLIIGLITTLISIGFTDSLQATILEIQTKLQLNMPSFRTLLAEMLGTIQDWELNLDLLKLMPWEFSTGNLLPANLLIIFIISSGLLWFIGNRILLPKISITYSLNGG